MAELEVPFRLPVDGWPRAVFESDYTYDGGQLVADDRGLVTCGYSFVLQFLSVASHDSDLLFSCAGSGAAVY